MYSAVQWKILCFTEGGALFFYPLHVTLLNVSEEMRKQPIVSSPTVPGYLPVEFDIAENSKKDICDGTRTKETRIHRNARLRLQQALHENINFCSKLLTNFQMLELKTYDKIEFFFYLLTFYTANFSNPKICLQSNKE